MKPNIIRHNLLRDFAVDELALGTLASAVESTITVYARLVVDGVTFFVIQATTVLDVVNVQQSVRSEYAWQEFAFPHIPESCDSVTDRKFFRVPNKGAGLSTFVGNRIKQAYDEAGLTGWLFNEARVPVDPWES